MSEIQVNAYLSNIQLTKLVTRADTLLQHILDVLTLQDEIRANIFLWLCDKKEFDDCLLNKSTESLDSDLSSSETFDSESSKLTPNEYDAKCGENSSINEIHHDNISNASSLIFDGNDTQFDEIANTNEGKFNPSSISETSLNNESFKFCRYCSSETNECFVPLMPIHEQIEQLRRIREPVLNKCHNITKTTRQRNLENNPQLRDLILYQDTLEMIDTVIEMKNNRQLINHTIQDFTNSHFLAYSTISNCLKTLSASEICYLFLVYIRKAVDIRENSYPLDKLILKLDNDIVDKELRLYHLNKNYETLKVACLSLSKKTNNKLAVSYNSPVDNINRALIKAHITQPKDESNQLLPEHVASKNKPNWFPTNLLNVPSKSLCVSRQGKKLVIHHNKQT